MSVKKLYVTGGSIIPQSDWNQTDETQVDYIKNKPTDLTTKTYVDEGLEKKQDTLTITSDIQEGNENPVTSGGVFTAIQSLTGGTGLVNSVNGKIGEVTLNAEDVGARAEDWLPTTTEIGAVPAKRLVNNKPLSDDIVLTASDVGALSSDTIIPSIPNKISAFENDVGYLIEHQSLDDFATKEYVTDIASKKADSLHNHSYDDINGLANVANSGDYNDLLNTPTSFPALLLCDEFAPIINDAVTTLQTTTSYSVNNGTKLVANKTYRIISNIFGIDTINTAKDLGTVITFTSGNSSDGYVWLYYYVSDVNSIPAGTFKIVRSGDDSLPDFDLQIYRVIDSPKLDTEPVDDSDNLVTSGGVFDALKNYLCFKRRLTAEDNMDDIVEPGVYYYQTGTESDPTTRPANCPFSNGSIVEVIATGETDQRVIQRCTRYGVAGHTKERVLSNTGAWLEWTTHPLFMTVEEIKTTNDNGNVLFTLDATTMIISVRAMPTDTSISACIATPYWSTSYNEWGIHITNSIGGTLANTEVAITIIYIKK